MDNWIRWKFIEYMNMMISSLVCHLLSVLETVNWNQCRRFIGMETITLTQLSFNMCEGMRLTWRFAQMYTFAHKYTENPEKLSLMFYCVYFPVQFNRKFRTWSFSACVYLSYVVEISRKYIDRVWTSVLAKWETISRILFGGKVAKRRQKIINCGTFRDCEKDFVLFLCCVWFFQRILSFWLGLSDILYILFHFELQLLVFRFCGRHVDCN